MARFGSRGYVRAVSAMNVTFADRPGFESDQSAEEETGGLV